ncbi:Myc-type basic helix-loop-helix (bHLH) domain [Trinorchestia longiramus]|nr:Myc-type basic helix-loop-helix (bHLH) domain [Trinorchestia longiramus]
MFAKVRTSHLQHKEDSMLATVKGGMDSEDREDSASEDSHPSTDASEDSVEVRVGGVVRPPPPNCSQNYSPGRSFSPQGSLSPTRPLSPPLIGLPRGCNSVSRLPPKLRKCYSSLASNSLSQVLNANPANPALAFAASYDRIQNPASKRLSGYGASNDETHTRRRKPAEPRRLYADQSNKRVHSPSPEYRASKSPKLSYDVPLKLQKLATPNPSPPLPAQTSPSSPPSSLTTSSLGAPPLIHHSLLSSPLVRTPTISPTLTPGIPRNLIPPRWPAASMSYQHYSRLLGSVLPNPLALLPGGLHIPQYPIVPLLHHLPVTPPVQSPSPQPPHNTCSPLPSPVKRLSISDSGRSRINDSIANRESQLQEEPVALVKRDPSKSLFSVASLVETKLKKSSSKPLPAAKTTPPSPATSVSRAPVLGLPSPSTTSPNLKLKSESTPSCSTLDASHVPLIPASRLPVVSSPTCSPAASGRLTQQQQQQQQLLRQKQRNYKNMTRERRIEANARERTRVHTISSAYEKLRQSVPSYSHNQKLSKLSILRIASSYILTLSKLAESSSDHVVADCVEETTRTIQFEGRAKKKRED